MHSFGEWPIDAIVQIQDINEDEHADILLTQSSGTHSIAWFEGPHDTKKNKWTQHIINEHLEKAHSLGLYDIDNDGDLDIISAEMHQSEDPDEVIVFRNEGGGIQWTKQVVAETGSHDIRVGDFDGDGDGDIFGANWNSVEDTGYAPIELWRNDMI